MLGLFGAALLYGDGVITPAISVLSAVEGLERRDRRVPARRRAASRAAILIGAVLGAEARHGRHRHRLRPGRCWSGSSRIARVGRAVDRAPPEMLARGQPALRGALLRGARPARLPRARLGRPRASPAARRSTPTWATSASAPIRLAWYSCRVPGAAPQLLRPGRAAPRAPRGRRATRSTRWSAAQLLYPDGRARDGGDGHRVAGADLGRVLADAAGGAARLLAARHDRPHLGRDRGADLRPRGQLAAHDRVRRARARLPASRATWRRRTASRSPARWRITSSSSTSVARQQLGLDARRRRARCSRCSSSFDLSFFAANARRRSRTAAGSRSRSRRVVFTVMTTWKRGRTSCSARRSPPSRCRSSCSSRTSSARTRTACRAPRCS